MRRIAGLLIASALALAAAPAPAQIARFQHIVLMVQENRTPDNLFYALCATLPCSTNPTAGQYDIQTSDWLTMGGTIQPGPIALANKYDLGHRHTDFLAMCDFDPLQKACKMDGAAGVICVPASSICPANPQFKYVDNSTGILAPYLFLATQYGWANYMFQTNQGPSFPAHQFLFGATSAPSRDDDHEGTFMSENARTGSFGNGCLAPSFNAVQLIDAKGVEKPGNTIRPCVEHRTLSDLLDAQSLNWRYYTPGAGDRWTAPDAIRHICQPVDGACTGAEWNRHLALKPQIILSHIRQCKLAPVSWVIPSAQSSDHARSNRGHGPAWVASVVNAIGNSACTNPDGSSYWNTTAIVVTWDDWGGWYDHEAPTFLRYPEGGYQYGFRVPMLFVSAYTPAGYINNHRLDFGAIARFVEFNFGIPMGALTFADERSGHNLASFYNLNNPPRAFQPVPGAKPSGYFTKMPLLPPDDD